MSLSPLWVSPAPMGHDDAGHSSLQGPVGGFSAGMMEQKYAGGLSTPDRGQAHNELSMYSVADDDDDDEEDIMGLDDDLPPISKTVLTRQRSRSESPPRERHRGGRPSTAVAGHRTSHSVSGLHSVTTDDLAMLGGHSARPEYAMAFKEGKNKKSRNENVQVMCRFRPENADERRRKAGFAVAFDDEDVSKVELQTKASDKRHIFQFDRVFRPYCTQEEVYDAAGSPVIEKVLEGFNAAIIAFGQTGAGKTFTMLGPGFDGNDEDISVDEQVEQALTDPGLTPRLMQQLFQRVASLESDEEEFTLRASYIEVYMELVKDLLAPTSVKENQSMKIRMDAERGLHLPEATEVPLHSLVDVFAVLRLGASNRRTSATKSNEHSSRSHAIFLVTMQRYNHTTKLNRLSQLYLVDLAGSEKVAKTDVSGKQMKEAQKINQSLLALGNVIFALAGAKKGRKVHVPYRSSKLTRLLQNCIGGNARTTLIINCSPSKYNAQETLSTLRFGDRTKKIKNKAVVNEEMSVRELKFMLTKVQKENAELKQELHRLQTNQKVMTTMQDFEYCRARIDAARPGDSDQLGVSTGPTVVEEHSAINTRADVPLQAWSSSTNPNNDLPPPSTTGISSAGKPPGLRQLVAYLMCPLSKVIMRDPVFCLDGYTYERRAIQLFLQQHSVSPVTGKALPAKILTPNHNCISLLRVFYPKVLLKSDVVISIFYSVPVDVISHIFSFLSHKHVCRIGQTCQEWSQLCKDQNLWKQLALREFKSVDPKLLQQNPSLKEYFRVKYRELHPNPKAEQRTKEKDQQRIGIRLVPRT